jgi:hypothetical protein
VLEDVALFHSGAKKFDCTPALISESYFLNKMNAIEIIDSADITMTLPHQVLKKFEKAFIRLHWVLMKKGVRIALRVDKHLSMFELSCCNDKSRFAGLVILYYPEENLFEVFEYQAGPNKELWIYGYYKSPMAALKKLLMADNIKNPIRIYR